MKIILIKDVRNIGKSGDIADVSSGYAMNYLIPKKFAVEATPDNIQKNESIKNEIKLLSENKLAECRKVAEEIKTKSFLVKKKAEGDSLYGSLTRKDVAQVCGHGIKAEMVMLEENIKTLGKRRIIIDFGNSIKAEILIDVVADK